MAENICGAENQGQIIHDRVIANFDRRAVLFEEDRLEDITDDPTTDALREDGLQFGTPGVFGSQVEGEGRALTYLCCFDCARGCGKVVMNVVANERQILEQPECLAPEEEQ